MKLQDGTDPLLAAAAEAVRTADALLIGAGAGMGVDSGLPDFRGPEGFWAAYPPFRGRQFSDLSTPHWFRTDPALAWGFFGHRLNLYRTAVPHPGFELLPAVGAAAAFEVAHLAMNWRGAAITPLVVAPGCAGGECA